jgi:phosphate transport system substrate-binding protein
VKRLRRVGLAVGLVTAASALPVLSTWAESLYPTKQVVDSGIASYQAKAGVTGAIVVAGSDSMQPIILKAASAFKLLQPGVKIAVQGGGSDAALDQFLQNQATIRRGDANSKGHHVSGHVDLLASSRPLTEEERNDFRSRYGSEPLEMPIAQDAIAIYVNQDNPVPSLTLEQLDALFSQSRKRGAPTAITTWGQLGLKDGWDEQPVRLYGRDKRSGTRAMFLHIALLDGTFRSDVKEQPGPAMEILDISRDRHGIGYAGIEFKASTVRIVPIASKAGETPVSPTAETATDRSYPLTRSLYLYAKRDSQGQLEPEIAEFLRFINSREGQETFTRAGVYSIPSEQVAANLRALGGHQVATAADLLAQRR